MQHTETSLASLIQEGEQLLKAADIEDCRREAQLLIAAALQKSITEIFMMDKNTQLDPVLIRQYFARRAEREPFAYIVKEQGFWSLDLAVSPATLIPRADTESLIEVLLTLLPDRQKPYRFLDLGTGTGCLLLAALSEYPNAFGLGVDKIEQAALLAGANAKQCQLENRSSFITGNWADAVQGSFDVILSNPPYIRKKELLELMPEVQAYEPMSALDGGEDGLDAYRYICNQAVDLLSDQGILILELGIKQDIEVSNIALSKGLYVVQKQHDLNGCIRALVLSRQTL
ncbi:peptide chain release factor N(5)-glutamine methyltransferase [Commensalibacter papalotli (ex Botero et al. 2024)]|uniref:peptide chain release factor N(5)-glutamine methyltransferase n=1 Tax=Commensalibacter papalotli (ex Botero et al. 2024) TaxID=2972766 RepID=A0ABM9HTW8_9PROT|nr:peptide chain release factor N(5)-glutamine methyltransferase [Commensalibacter papalotli (ex Botero et al. 2024)]CAI3956632.1 Methylase of polypeptide chain release factors (HemK) (PDB:1NV8) [Commensalibacter papalotli (ex Botero et al. 2024)]CAI3956777.1 Methylase of polypeptide chain release factors (HemK) (PDB:1NV8) [Commensalibacter papalotli (ex Botero et al. 2024)]